jgi:hypothetical protein
MRFSAGSVFEDYSADTTPALVSAARQKILSFLNIPESPNSPDVDLGLI